MTRSAPGQSHRRAERELVPIRIELLAQRAARSAALQTFAAMFQVDYADGLSRPDTTISIFNSQGQLLLIGRGSDILDSQPEPGAGATHRISVTGNSARMTRPSAACSCLPAILLPGAPPRPIMWRFHRARNCPRRSARISRPCRSPPARRQTASRRPVNGWGACGSSRSTPWPELWKITSTRRVHSRSAALSKRPARPRPVSRFRPRPIRLATSCCSSTRRTGCKRSIPSPAPKNTSFPTTCKRRLEGHPARPTVTLRWVNDGRLFTLTDGTSGGSSGNTGLYEQLSTADGTLVGTAQWTASIRQPLRRRSIPETRRPRRPYHPLRPSTRRTRTSAFNSKPWRTGRCRRLAATPNPPLTVRPRQPLRGRSGRPRGQPRICSSRWIPIPDRP